MVINMNDKEIMSRDEFVRRIEVIKKEFKDEVWDKCDAMDNVIFKLAQDAKCDARISVTLKIDVIIADGKE